MVEETSPFAAENAYDISKIKEGRKIHPPSLIMITNIKYVTMNFLECFQYIIL